MFLHITRDQHNCLLGFFRDYVFLYVQKARKAFLKYIQLGLIDGTQILEPSFFPTSLLSRTRKSIVDPLLKLVVASRRKSRKNSTFKMLLGAISRRRIIKIHYIIAVLVADIGYQY